jgi:acetyl esterase/lipase
MRRRLIPTALLLFMALSAACTGTSATEPSIVSVPSPPAVPESNPSTVPGPTQTTADPTAASTAPGSGREPTETTAISRPSPTTVPDVTSDPAPAVGTDRPTATVPVLVDRDIPVPGGLAADIWYPADEGPWPVVVLFHGGGWLSGSKDDLGGFARALTEGGVVVVNAGYSPLDQGGVFPQMFEEATCAVAAAQSIAAEYSGTGPVTVIGFSAGAHVASVATLSNGAFDAGCAQPIQPAGAFVGIAGPYDSDQFPFLALQFGGLITEVPEAWAAGNPYSYAAGGTDLDVLLLHGEKDIVVNPRFSADFRSFLIAAGYEVDSEIFSDVGHFSIVRMDENGGPTAAAALDFIWGLAPG